MELIDEVKVFPRLEANRFSGCDADLCAGSRISSDARLTGFDGKDTEAAKLNAFAGNESLFHALEDGVDGRLGLGPRKPGTLNNPLDKILLNHAWSAFPDRAKGG